jgi:hypothetical protein
VTIERGLRRIVLSLSIAVAVMGGWLGYGDVQVSQRLTPSAESAMVMRNLRAKYPEYGDMTDQALAAAVVKKYPQYQDVLGDIAHPPNVVVAKENLTRRILTVGLWGLVPFAVVWAAFFFLRWILMGFRGAER